jgi:hypothetical protein
MTIIRLRRLSLCEAEEALAALWICLEEYGIPTPHIDFHFEAAGRATLSLRIDPEWDHVVRRRLATSIAGCWLSGLRVETAAGGRAHLHTNDRPTVCDSRRRARESVSRLHGLLSGEGLDPLVAMDTSTIRSIH